MAFRSPNINSWNGVTIPAIIPSLTEGAQVAAIYCSMAWSRHPLQRSTSRRASFRNCPSSPAQRWATIFLSVSLTDRNGAARTSSARHRLRYFCRGRLITDRNGRLVPDYRVEEAFQTRSGLSRRNATRPCCLPNFRLPTTPTAIPSRFMKSKIPTPIPAVGILSWVAWFSRPEWCST